MAPFTPSGNPQRRSLYGAGNESYPTRQSSHYNTTKSGDSAGGGSNSYSTGRGSYGGGDSKNTYTDGTAKYGVGDTGKNSYMTGVSNIAPEKPSPKGWSKVFKASFPKGGVMRSSAGSNVNGGTGNSYAEKDTSSLYYTGGAAYQKGGRSAPAKSAPKRKSYADSIPMPASMSLADLMMGDEPGYAAGGSVGFGIAPPTRPVIPQPGMQPPPDYRSMGKGFGQRLGGMFQSIGDRWRGAFGDRMAQNPGMPRQPGMGDDQRGWRGERPERDDDYERGMRGGMNRPERDHSYSAPYLSNMPRQPYGQHQHSGYQSQPAQPPAGGYPPPPASMAPPPMQQAPAAPAAPGNNIPPPAYQNRYWGR